MKAAVIRFPFRETIPRAADAHVSSAVSSVRTCVHTSDVAPTCDAHTVHVLIDVFYASASPAGSSLLTDSLLFTPFHNRPVD